MSSAEAYSACIALSTNSTVVGSVNDCVNWAGGNLTLTNAGSISSSTNPALTASASAATLTNNGLLSGTSFVALLNTASALTVVNNSRIISDTVAILNNATIVSLTNTASGTISGNMAGITNNLLINNLSNSGTLSGGVGINNIGSISNIGTLSNSGTISGTTLGIQNNGIITSLTNNTGGTISGSIAGVQNNNTLSSLVNNSVISGDVGVFNAGSMNTLSNTGDINGLSAGIRNTGLISGLVNSGSISGTSYGVHSDNGSQINFLMNSSTGVIEAGTAVLAGNLTPSGTININMLTNAGLISGTTNVGVGTSSNGSIGSLNNSGIITGAAGAIGNAGSIGSLVNSGTISSSGYAIYNAATGTLGPVTNSGLIAGMILNLSTSDLTINGGTGSIFGTLTGSSGSIDSASMGSLTSNSADLYFTSGNLLLNDNVRVGSFALRNTGSTLQVNNLVSITGNYTQSTAATLLIGVSDSAVSNGVTADTGYGRLVVSGAATIDSGSTVALKSLNTYKFASGQRYVVVTAAQNGTNYNAGTLNYLTSGYTGVTSGSVVNTGNTSNLVLTLSTPTTEIPGETTNPTNPGNPDTPTNPTNPGNPTNPATPTNPGFATTGNAISSLQGLQKYTGIAPGMLDLYNASLAIDSTGEANKVGEQLSPVQNSSASHVASIATFDAIGVVGQRVDAVRLAQSHGMTGVATGDDPTDWSAWGQVFGGHANQGMVDDVSGYKANYGGLVLGLDRSLTESWQVGGALTYSYTSVRGQDNLSGNKTGVDSYGLIGYAGYTGSPWFVNLTASVTQQRFDTTRNVDLTGYSDQASGKFNGQQYVTKAEFGYPLAVAESTTLTPLANLSYSYQTQDSYKESSNNGSALSVSGSHNNAVRSGMGARLEKSFETGVGDLVPYAQAIWTHQYNPQRTASTASYIAASAGETSFTTFGASPVEDTADLSVGATLVKSDTLSLNARYNVQLGEQYQGQTVSLQVRKAF
jgi:outer membrane autotransporter protein